MAMGDFNGTIWDSVKEGDKCTCGFLQVDIVRSSHLEGSPQDIQKTKENFRNFVTSILENLYDALEFRWEGDGGAFIFLIKDQNKDYDMVVKAAIQVLTNMPFFNGMRKLLNLLDQDIIIRISCHAGEIVYSKKVGNIHGEELNFFLKHEKEIMKHEDAITLTEDIYNKLRYLRDYFEQSGPFEYNVKSGRYSKMLYKSKDWIKWYPRGDDFLDLAVTIRKIAANNTPFGKTLLAFAKDSLQTLKNNMDGLRSEKGALLTLPDLINLTNYCFKYATSKSNKYYGTDRCTPSKFFKTYPSYLESQADFIKRNETSGDFIKRNETSGTRILIVEDDTLRKDKNENNESYMEFLKWHQEHRVSLKKIDPLDADELKKDLSIPSSEFGIWDKCYALIFKPEGDKTRLWLAYPGERMYDECKNYFELLDNEAREFTTELFDKKLAENWEEFIWPEKRWETEKDFLLKILEPYRGDVILDAAAGIGVDYVYLKKEGFNCFANEIEPELRRVGEQFTSKRLNVAWIPYSIAWEDFGRHFNSDWDVILVLGNSFCLILDERTREKCIENFMKALKPGGMLVIDQRNFEYMLKNKEEIQQDPIKNFRYKEEFVYCQQSIKGVPYDFGKNVKGAITFIYFPKHIKDIKEAYKKRIGQLHMYPFRKGELRSLLEKKGFKEIKEYSDFKEGYDEGADFFTYTAIRPKET